MHGVKKAGWQFTKGRAGQPAIKRHAIVLHQSLRRRQIRQRFRCQIGPISLYMQAIPIQNLNWLIHRHSPTVEWQRGGIGAIASHDTGMAGMRDDVLTSARNRLVSIGSGRACQSKPERSCASHRGRIALRTTVRSSCSNASANCSNSFAVMPIALPRSRHRAIAVSTAARISLVRAGLT